jgi:hypothetical protein
MSNTVGPKTLPEITRTLREALQGERGGNMPVPIADLGVILAALEGVGHETQGPAKDDPEYGPIRAKVIEQAHRHPFGEKALTAYEEAVLVGRYDRARQECQRLSDLAKLYCAEARRWNRTAANYAAGLSVAVAGLTGETPMDEAIAFSRRALGGENVAGGRR